MNPRLRRVLQAVLYEGIAVGFVGPGLAWLFSNPITSSIALAALMSAFALAWSILFNTIFERWESRRAERTRSFIRRAVHALGFEGGIVVTLVPVMAWWLNTTLFAAFVADLAVLAFFFFYSFVFTWTFDRIFGLPAAVAQGCEA